MSLPLTTTRIKHCRISIECPPGTSASGRKSLLQRVHHIYRGLYTGPTDVLSPQSANSFLGLMSNQPEGASLKLSITVVKMGTSTNVVTNRWILPMSAMQNVADGLTLLRMPVMELLTKSILRSYYRTMGTSLELQMRISLYPPPLTIRPVIGSSDPPAPGSHEDAGPSSPTCIPNHLTSGGMDINASPTFLSTMSTAPTPPGSEVSLKSGPTTMDLSPKQKENHLRLDQKDFWSHRNTQFRSCLPGTPNYKKRCIDALNELTLKQEPLSPSPISNDNDLISF